MPKTPKMEEPTAIVLVALTQLSVSEHNVRAHSDMDATELDTLAASIASVGLLQPLVVIEHGDTFGAYEVVAGARRFAALQLIKDRGVLADIKVPVKIIDPAHATEASLAENRARVQMSSVELYGAFKKLADEGMDTDAIGRAFGYDRARVERVLRLALLHPSIMKAWSDGEISEDQARAFASTDDQALQDEVATALLEDAWGNQWRNIGGGNAIRHAIKRRIQGEEVSERVVKFVGVEAYEAAGGKLTRDLFSDAVAIADPALLTRLADDKTELVKATDEARISRADGGDKNIEWADKAPQINRYGYDSDDTDLLVTFEPTPLSPEAQQRQQEIEETLVAHEDGSDEIEDEDALFALEEELEALLECDLSTGPLIIPEGKGKVILVGAISHKGTFDVRAFYENRDAAGLPPLAKSNEKATAATGTVSVAEQAKKDLGASRDGFMAMQVLFADRVSLRLEDDAAMRRSTLGLDALLFGLARTQKDGVYGTEGYPGTRSPERGNAKVRGLTGDDAPKMFDTDWFKAIDAGEAFDLFIDWIDNGNNRAELGARLLAMLWSPLASGFREEQRPKFVRLIAEAAYGDEGSVGVADEMPRVKALDLMSHKARVALLNEWGLGDHAKGLKKDTSAAFVAKVIAADGEQRKLWNIDEDTGAAIDAWLPSELAVEPVARPVPEPVADKPKAKGGKAKAKKELADA